MYTHTRRLATDTFLFHKSVAGERDVPDEHHVQGGAEHEAGWTHRAFKVEQLASRRVLRVECDAGKGLSQSPRTAYAIAHTRTRRDGYTSDCLRNTRYERLTLSC